MKNPETLGIAGEDAEDPGRECVALAQVIDRIGDKWTVMVVGHLSSGAMRFNAIQRAIPGISHRMLTLTLRGLQRDGLVDRRSFGTVPPRVEYRLTALGQSLCAPLTALAAWASDHRRDVETARHRYDAGDS
ncbi:MAG: winged helix-turn-helix transcriptional regulator [Sphingobium phenoxybenzoativorans]|uniref:winged helix-turn-helix transcriptional regulator n=1 Tax=Sphingobium phenoxybenzoativorans TaxID=1592790 RepID=UPI000871FEF4|nr:helix-turn-helix domain-containing protein [Sphingobium phenoxybenzoativorans]